MFDLAPPPVGGTENPHLTGDRSDKPRAGVRVAVTPRHSCRTKTVLEDMATIKIETRPDLKWKNKTKGYLCRTPEGNDGGKNRKFCMWTDVKSRKTVRVLVVVRETSVPDVTLSRSFGSLREPENRGVGRRGLTEPRRVVPSHTCRVVCPWVLPSSGLWG